MAARNLHKPRRGDGQGSTLGTGGHTGAAEVQPDTRRGETELPAHDRQVAITHPEHRGRCDQPPPSPHIRAPTRWKSRLSRTPGVRPSL